MAWSPSNPTHTTGALRRQVFDRDRGQCQTCGEPGTEVDHIINLKSGGTNALENLQLLCRSCHNRKTQAEAAAARKARQACIRLPKQRHPGLV